MKTLEKLFEKATRTGHPNLNGRMRIWGTLIVKIGSLKASKPIVKDFYGESKSDRDALCWLFDHLELPYYAKYRPSIDEFSVCADFGKGIEETVKA